MALSVPTLLVLAFSCAPQQSQPAAGPKAPPTPGVHRAPMPVGEMVERHAWLGVMVEPLRPDVAMQLPLRKGAGLVVGFVEPNSPAESAGLKRFDIIEMVGDQFVMNPEQFMTLITSEEPGAKVQITWLRRGERTRADLALGERAMPARQGALEVADDADAADGDDRDTRVEVSVAIDGSLAEQLEQSLRDAMPDMPDEQRREMLKRIIQSLHRDAHAPRPDAQQQPGRPRVTMQDRRDAPRGEQRDGPRDAPHATQRDGHRVEQRTSVMRSNDGSLQITIRQSGDERSSVRVEDMDGSVLWEGHLADNASFDGIPEEFRDRVRDMMRDAPKPPPTPRTP